MDKRSTYTSMIKAEAKRLGFSGCGISRAGFLENEAPRLEQWLKKGLHGKMYYMENHFDKRLDPRLLVDDAKTVVSLVYNYFPKAKPKNSTFKISKYALGQDYHTVVRQKAYELLAFIRASVGEVGGRAFVDSAPIMERAWAVKGGLGWQGKNSNLIMKRAGSFFFIAELIIDLNLIEDSPIDTEHCGSCTACIDACPTQAIVEPFVIDSNKCISYLTIELKDEMPKAFENKMEDWIFGCDICQDVCPWNRFSKPHQDPLLEASDGLLRMTDDNWKDLTEETFQILFKNSAIKRTKYKGIKRNIAFLNKKL